MNPTTLPKNIALILIEQRLFQHELLLRLIQAGALTQQQAASICTTVATQLPEATPPGSEGNTLLPLLVRKLEDTAAALLGRDPLPRG